MPAIVLKPFLGIAPAIHPRNLPDGGAVRAHNIDSRRGEFAPRLSDLNVATSGVTNPQTIYRFTRTALGALNTDASTGWTVKAGDVDYVKGQTLEDANERTYYTGDGAPKATDTSGTVRDLGVPIPTTPSTSLTEVDEYTTEERASDIESVKATLAGEIRAALSYAWIGASDLTGLTLRTAANGYAEDVPFNAVATFSGVSDGGSGRKLADPETDGWTLDERANGFWNAAGNMAVPVVVYGYRFQVNAGLPAALLTLTRPNDSQPVLTSDQATDLYNTVVDHFAEDAFVQQRKAEFDVLIGKFKALVGRGLESAKVEAVQDFYARTDVASAIDAAKDVFADRIYEIARALATTVSFFESSGP